jgi:hypothetical protein
MYTFGIIACIVCFIGGTVFVKAFHKTFANAMGDFPELDRIVRLCAAGLLLAISTIVQNVSLLIIVRQGLIRFFSMKVPLPNYVIVLYCIIAISIVLFSAYRKGRRTSSI